MAQPSKKEVPIDVFFAALADRTRLRLLNLLAEGEICVCFFVETLRAGQPKISRHLAYLRRAGLVAARRDGKWIHYRLERPVDPHRAKLLDAVVRFLADDPEMQNDRSSLLRACCSLKPELREAPKPRIVADEATR
ncbi:MAG: ArsR/SmtB family transcription factor [Thermoanaerobaculia bacterium]